MGDLVGPIIEILKWVGPPLYKWIDYHRKLEDYQETFKRTLDELISQKDEIELRLKTEGFGKLPKNEVENWLKSAQIIIDEYHAKSIVQASGKRKYFSRASLAKLVEKKIQRVQNLLEESKSFHSLVIDAPLDSGTIFPTTALTGETTAKKYMEEIWRQLMGNEIEKIGVFGMGGVGKSTIMTHVNNRLVEQKKFDHVFWITVSQALDVNKIQNEIAIVLKRSHYFSGTEDPKQRAGKLSSMLKGQRFILILDDIWKAIHLEEVGIPEPTKENGCKLVITTRSREVCQQMGCKPIKVMPLSEEEAIKLFLERAELDISKVPTLKETVELVLKQCAGLPLAIVTVASSMKGEYDVLEWRNALNELPENIRSIKIEMDDAVFAKLKFSYDRLSNENIQRCFLYCALYPEDFDIPKNELVDCWIREGFVDEMHYLQAKEDKARFIMKKLINNCLLLESTDRVDRSCVKLHDVVRDMSLKYIASESPLFMVKAGLNLGKVPDDQEWKENLDKVSLMRNHIREISSSMSPNCKTLSTLLLQENPLESIPESFFSQMHELKILDLSWTEIESLPNSISELTNLTALLLKGCGQLKHVPSLAKLRSLGELDLGSTGINEVPAGIEMLTNLTSLGLLSMKLHKLPVGMFPKLCHLERLQVHWGWETPRLAVKETTRLKTLDCLVALFCNLQDFNCYAKSLNSHRYRLLLDPNYLYPFDRDPRIQLYDTNKEVILQGCNICKRKEVNSIFLPKDLEALIISSCYDVRNVCDIPTFNTLERLEILVVDALEKLTILLNVSESSSGQYSHLKGVYVRNCNRLKKMFSSKLLSALKNLEWIRTWSCTKMGELIAVDDGDNNDERNQKEFRLPKLKSLDLAGMSNLKSICSCKGVMVFESLQVIKVARCPKLKKIISTSKLQLDVLKNLEKIVLRLCDDMEEIIALDDGDEEETSKKELINLPKLRSLYLYGMPNLKSIINSCGSNGIMVCESLQQVTILKCSKLKRLPLYLPSDEKGQPSPPPALQKISISREWWEALEWDHLHSHAKSLLLPFCTFY